MDPMMEELVVRETFYGRESSAFGKQSKVRNSATKFVTYLNTSILSDISYHAEQDGQVVRMIAETSSMSLNNEVLLKKLREDPRVFSFSFCMRVDGDDVKAIGNSCIQLMDYKADSYENWKFTTRGFTDSLASASSLSKHVVPLLKQHLAKPVHRQVQNTATTRELLVDLGQVGTYLSIDHTRCAGLINVYAQKALRKKDILNIHTRCFLLQPDEGTLKGSNSRQFEEGLIQLIRAKTKQFSCDVRKVRNSMMVIPQPARPDQKHDPEGLQTELSSSSSLNISNPRVDMTTARIHALQKVFRCLPGVSLIYDGVLVGRSPSLVIAELQQQLRTSPLVQNEKVFLLVKGDFPGVEGAEADKAMSDFRHALKNAILSNQRDCVVLHPLSRVRMKEEREKSRCREVSVWLFNNRTAFVSSLPPTRGVYGIPHLPLSSNIPATAVALLSGGFDSPVAAYRMMSRGCRVVLTHFQNVASFSEDAVKDKVMQLAKVLSRYQIETHLFIVPFRDLQQDIIMKISAAKRMLIYKSFMLRLAARVAARFDSQLLVVGDAMGQVASQTVDNIVALYRLSPMPVLAPLIGMNKVEIVDIANEIGTGPISALPYGDCCSYFLAKHPETEGTDAEIRSMIDSIDPSLEVEAVNGAYHAIIHTEDDIQVVATGEKALLDEMEVVDDGQCILETWSNEAQAQQLPRLQQTATTNLSSRPVYLDNAATTQVDDAVALAMLRVLERKSTIHRAEMRNFVKSAKQILARSIGSNDLNSIVFTSGGTEANNLAIHGALRSARLTMNVKRFHFVTCTIEHESVLAVMRHLQECYSDVDVSYIGVDARGVVDLEALRECLRLRAHDTVLVSIMHGNNEIGVVQDIHTIATICKTEVSRPVLFHTDACQSFGKIPLTCGDHIDFMSLNAHKLHGPKGIGALYIRDAATIQQMVYGSTESSKLRGGSMDGAAIAGFVEAVQISVDLKSPSNLPKSAVDINDIRNRLFATVCKVFPSAQLHGPALPTGQLDNKLDRLPNNVALSLGNILPTPEEVALYPQIKSAKIRCEGEQLVAFLSARGIFCSTASACSSNKTDVHTRVSHVLTAIGLPREVALGSVRLTVSRFTKVDELDRVENALRNFRDLMLRQMKLR